MKYFPAGVQSIMGMSRQDLLRQKQLLDLLIDIEQPLQQPELLQLSETILMDASKYIGVGSFLLLVQL